MTQSKLDRLWRSYANQSRSITLVRWLGYGLLFLALLDLAVILIPLNLTDPVWEFRSTGAIVDRLPVPLIGFVMVFWGGQDYRRPRERLILKGLTWSTLSLALVLLILIPLCLVNSMRIYNFKVGNINALRSQRLALVERLEDKLSQTNSVEEFQQLLNQAMQNRSAVRLDTSQSLSVLKAQMPTYLEPAKSAIKQQATIDQEQANSERPGLLKRAVKWSLGALVGAVICLRIWQETRWARKKSYL
ncbi:HpsJ family protein [Acaryochloris sp. IP29b_bin.148]|uniref:HpsJ-like protein, cyanoexosortase A-associated n=1 Tax=Acaryochloris sp. IP29b_bin.148 TaxID=2969218 RepID=UPI00262603C1|nr:HpsJ family protein [Acaryochloris sp. IP29b_bin.148]